MSLSPSPSSSETLIEPWRAQTGPQLTAIQLDDVDELLFGGAVFGGKSDYLLGDFCQDVPRPYGKFWHGILFRKSYKQLEDLISRSKVIYPRWFPGCRWTGSSKEIEKAWIWPNGATLRMRHMDSEDDWQEYWGHAYTWIGWDELALWASPTAYKMMKARLRSAQSDIPNKRIRASANPGGPGHHWVRAYFKIDEYPMGGETFTADDGSGMRRVFIRSRLSDNRIGMHNDPGYAQRLEGTGSPELVRALKEGDWTIVAGSYFPEFNPDKHVVEPFEIPAYWARIRGMDWGSAKPFCVHWAAVSDGEVINSGSTSTKDTRETMLVRATSPFWTEDLSSMPPKLYACLEAVTQNDSTAKEKGELQELCSRLSRSWETRPQALRELWQRELSNASPRLRQAIESYLALSVLPLEAPRGRVIPRGTLVIYREWYGWNGEPNVGCKMPAEQVGAGIKQLEHGEKIADQVLDPSAFASDGGPSIAERLGLGFRRADNSRVAQGGRMGGWDQVRSRLTADEAPGILIFSTCTHLIRTLPALQHDSHRPEDVDTDAEDHAPDTLRYICMARPFVRSKPKNEPPKFETQLTVSELIKRRTQRRLAE